MKIFFRIVGILFAIIFSIPLFALLVATPVYSSLVGVIDADTIVVMDNGCITGVGTHEELLASNTEYQEIYYSQMEKKEA